LGQEAAMRLIRLGFKDDKYLRLLSAALDNDDYDTLQRAFLTIREQNLPVLNVDLINILGHVGHHNPSVAEQAYLLALALDVKDEHLKYITPHLGRSVEQLQSALYALDLVMTFGGERKKEI